MILCDHQPCEQKTYDLAPYCWYHTKMEAGLLQTVDSYINPTELNALFRGRDRHDGRRLDAWAK